MVMNKKEKLIIYFIFLLFYILLGYYNYTKGSEFLLDNILSIAFLTFIFLITKFLKIHKLEFILLNIALFIHNLGSFGFYAWNYLWIGYDNIVHFFSSFVTGFIVFNFITRKLHTKKGKYQKYTIIDEHTAIIIFLVIATVAMLGTCIEILEFTGYTYFGESDNILAPGASNSGFDNYSDTMMDIIVNLFGSLVGVNIYYFSVYKKKLWLK